jgi:lysocardiolipin and lysophospholipid acyltransferase
MDWLYLWWVSFVNRPSHHGHIYIILKESLKYIPIIGLCIRFFGFILMSRKIEKDKPRIAHRLQKLIERHSGPMSGKDGLDPMWLLLFPEGTYLSKHRRIESLKWAEKQGIPDLQHQLLPRSTGAFFCLNELRGTVDWVYDCTFAYEGIP